MARLSAEQWEQARAEYEIRGGTFQHIADLFGLDRAAVSRRAKTEGWKSRRNHGIVEKKVNAIKMLNEAQKESHVLPVTFQHTIETVVREELQAAGVRASFDIALLEKGLEILRGSKSPEQWETMTRGRRNLAPPREPNQTTVNMLQQAQQSVIKPDPQEVVEDLCRALRGEFRGD